MSSIDRRRFLEVGGLGVGYGLATGAPRQALAQAESGSTGAVSAPAAAGGNVRMSGDGLGLAPEEQARLWTALAADGGIVRDSYSNGGAVERLENAFAELLGKERTVFMPTGTLANHLGVRALAGGEGRAIVQADSHLYNDSGDCVQTLSGITLIPLGSGRPDFTLEDVEATLDRTASGRVRTPVRVISIETPVRRHFGATFDRRELDRIAALAHREGIRLHLDGARIFLQAAYEGRSVAEYAAPFDTVYVSLYKYFNAPSGAILAGPRDLLDGMYHTRRMFGAGLPAAWPFATIAHHYLPGFVERYTLAVHASESWLAQVARHDAFSVERVPKGTNLFWLRVKTGDISAFRRRLRDRGVALGAPRDGRILVGVNETWNRRPVDELAELFVDSV
ncbi:MAG: aminotransferase class I/II-fold pyridoxal phosphate-dependent enzyme [Acidobacteria bacterium]|nr:aminotransferase class I/II-fold pyridoxal phosphate-dependent enzyme [Acidobacteriota bacterium]